MLKKRLMGVVVVRDGVAVQSLGFRRYLPVGKPRVVVSFLNAWGIDEISVLDITASRSGRLDLELVNELSGCCQVPLAFGGGIKSAEDMTRVVQAGADKVMINLAFLDRPEVIGEGAARLGAQCVVVSLDVLRDEDGALRAYDYRRRTSVARDPVDLARLAETHGAGEIFLNSVDRDGAKAGYDLEAAASVARAVRIPVTICGGVGRADHFEGALRISNVSAVAAGNYFNFTEHSVTVAKQYLLRQDAQLRHDTHFDYADSPFAEDVRLGKKDDRVLKEMLFEFHPPEVI